MNKIAILLMSFSLAICQPGKPGGPGGQYGNKMEMMMVWKMTEYLNLSEQQAEKLFPRMRRQRIKMDDFFVTEKELFDLHLSKIKKGEKITQSDVDAVYNMMQDLTDKKNDLKRFSKKTEEYILKLVK